MAKPLPCDPRYANCLDVPPATPPTKQPSWDIGQALLNGIGLLGGEFLGVGRAQQAQKAAELRAEQAQQANAGLKTILYIAGGLLALAIIFGGRGGSGGVLKGFKSVSIRR